MKKYDVLKLEKLTKLIIQCINDNTLRPLLMIRDNDLVIVTVIKKLKEIKKDNLIKFLNFAKKENINLNFTMEYGWTILMKICTLYKFDLDNSILKLLIKLGVKLNLKNSSDGYTALMLVVINGDIKKTKILIEAGADVNIKTFNGNTALDYAKRNNNNELIELLKSNGAK